MDEQFPVVDITAYYTTGSGSPDTQAIIRDLHKAASTWGYFILKGTPVPEYSQFSLLSLSQIFFSLSPESRMALDVRIRDAAWRGYMLVSGGHRNGTFDWKEGLYFGPEHDNSHPNAGLPLHGKNQFPDDELPGMRHVTLNYIQEVTELGKVLADLFSLGLELPEDELRQSLLQPEPTVLLRCYKYGAVEDVASKKTTGKGDYKEYVDEHTDIGFLTISMIDSHGLQVLSPSDEWVDVPVIANSFIVGVGDMFDRLTHGRYRSRPHRARRMEPGSERFSFPLFLDFAWDAKMERLPLDHLAPLSDEEQELAKQRWAATTIREVSGTWSQFIVDKMQNILPVLSLPVTEPQSATWARFVGLH